MLLSLPTAIKNKKVIQLRCFTIMLMLMLVASSIASAQLIPFDNGRSLRYRAMGGVNIPFANDADAIFFNPAGLGKASMLDIKMIDFATGVNANSVSLISAIGSLDVSNPSSVTALLDKQLWTELTGKTAFSLPFLSVGYLTDYEIYLELKNPTLPVFETYFRKDDSIYLGGSFTLGPSSYLGFAFKKVSRWGGITSDIPAQDLAGLSTLSSISDQFTNKGQGYGIDMGINVGLPLPVLKPTFSLVWQDIGGTAFTKTEGTTAPPHIQQNLAVGAGLALDLPGLDWMGGVEVRHLLDADIEFAKKLHIGTELSIPFIDLRAGFDQGYLTYGVGLSLLIFHFDAVSYSPIGTYYPDNSGDSYYMASLSIDLSFDANFKFTDNDGKRRKLKQRR